MTTIPSSSHANMTTTPAHMVCKCLVTELTAWTLGLSWSNLLMLSLALFKTRFSWTNCRKQMAQNQHCWFVWEPKSPYCFWQNKNLSHRVSDYKVWSLLDLKRLPSVYRTSQASVCVCARARACQNTGFIHTVSNQPSISSTLPVPG